MSERYGGHGHKGARPAGELTLNREIVLVTNDDLLVVPRYLDGTLKRIHRKVCVVILTPLYEPGRFLAHLKKYASCYGLGFFVPLVARTLRRQVDIWRGQADSVQTICRRYQIPCRGIADLNSGSSIRSIQRYGAQILLLLGCAQRLHSPFIRSMPGTILNVHSALLPKYRGLNAPFWALRYAESHAGVTVHKIKDERIDAGDILAQKPVAILPSDSYMDLALRIAETGPAVIEEALGNLEAKTENVIVNNTNLGSYKSWPTREDIKAFHELGRRFF